MAGLFNAVKVINDEILWRGLCEVLWAGTALGRRCPQPVGSATGLAEASGVGTRGSSGGSGNTGRNGSCSSSGKHCSPPHVAIDSGDDGLGENPLFGRWAVCRCSRTPLDRRRAAVVEVALPRALAMRTAARRSPAQAADAGSASSAPRRAEGGGVGEAAAAPAAASAAGAAAGEAALGRLEVVCEEVRLLSFRESYVASLKDRRRVRDAPAHTQDSTRALY